MKQVIILGMVLLLAACGGGNRDKGKRSSGSTTRASTVAYGPISRACLDSDRKARSRQLCGCIQAAADQTLSGGQQLKAVKFYSDPHLAQEIRQSDRESDERFWKAYKAYGEKAKQLCG